MINKISEIAEYLGRFLLLAAILYGVWWFFKSDVPEIKEAPGGKVTQEFVEDNISDKKQSEKVYEKIVTIREEARTPTYSFPANTPQKDIDAAVKEDGGDVVLSEKTDKTEGTNIYSIHTDSSRHGIGIYAGASTNKGLGSVAAGIHVRNKRWVYQVGLTKDGGVDARVAYEVIQW